MSEAKHTGGCHCGAVRYEVRGLDLSKPVLTCNCSMCGRSGTMLAFVPAAQFTLLTDEAALKDYTFKTNTIHHLFCTTCGIRSFARGAMPDGSPMAAVNVRCLDDVELDELQIQKFNGRAA
jgi:hypothetical protein